MKYAIVESGGKQYKAVEGGTIIVDRLPVEAGKHVKLEQVLLLADGENYTVGTPVVKDTPVWTIVVEHFRGEKVTIFNYRPKKRIRVKTGHRQNYTRLLVEQIGGSALVKKEPVVKAEPEEKAEPKAEKKPAASSPRSTQRVKGKAEPKKEAVKAAPKKAAPKKAEPKAAPAKKTTTTKAAPKKTAPKAAPKAAPEKKTPATTSPKGKKAPVKKAVEK
ncbi:MAG: large subunit ribosomal protein L21 [Anaerolineaceae bacterium]|nr:MAG: large subunit ribosomal protein L21 [Anaerolineaceae bacterium]